MTRLIIRLGFVALWLSVGGAMTGCAQLMLGQPQASAENLQKARATGMAPVALGSFALAAGKPADMDKAMSVRSNSVQSPVSGSFALHLKETLAAELAAAGLVDPASTTVIAGTLTDSVLDVPVGRGTGTLAARFVVTRDGAQRYDKELRVSADWDAPFVGAVAIPAAMNEFSALFRKIVGKLFDDPDFVSAVKR